MVYTAPAVAEVLYRPHVCTVQTSVHLTMLMRFAGAAGAQENAAAFSVELSQEDKTYLEDIFSPQNVGLSPRNAIVTLTE